MTKKLVDRLRDEMVEQSSRCGEEDSQDRALLAEEAANEIERLLKREKDLMDVIDSRDRALGFVPLDEVHASEPCEQLNPFDSAAILAAPRERRISMSFETQEQYEAALVFLDMADEGASRDASPADLVGALQDVVHTDPGPVRAGKAVKSDVTRGPCAVCGTTDDHHGFGCPVG